MKVSLINPNLDGFTLPNAGLAYLISAIDDEHKVQLLDLTFHAKRYKEYILSSINEFKPDIIGFSVTSYIFLHALKIASLIRKRYPEIPLVYGGVHPTLMPEETIKHPLVDAICIGDGENSFKEYLRLLENKEEPKGIAGMWYKGLEGNIVRNPLRPFIENLDSLPFPNWDYWDIEKYIKNNIYFLDSLEHMTSRGCPFSCAFCSGPAIRRAVPGKYYRLRSPEKVIEEIKLNIAKYHSKGLKNIAFTDPTFGVDLNYLKRFCSLYKKEGLHLDFPWVCQTNANVITEEWASTAAGAGCFMVGFGIESGNDYIRNKVYKKNVSKEQLINAANILKRNSIIHTVFIIIGCFEETLASIKETMNMLKKMMPVSTYVSFYQPLPMTELGEARKKYIIKSHEEIAKPWSTACISVKGISTFMLEMSAFKMLVDKTYRFFAIGIKSGGIKFIADVIKYLLFPAKRCATMTLRNHWIVIDLEYSTLYRCLLVDWKKNFLIKAAKERMQQNNHG